MEKRLLVFFALIIAIIMASFALPVLGEIGEETYSVNVEVTLEAEGVGTIDRDLNLQSSSAFVGQKLSETISPFLNHKNLVSVSNSFYSKFVLSKDDSLFYVQNSSLTAIRHDLTAKNYDLGTSTSFHFSGSQKKKILFGASPLFSETTVFCEAKGQSVLRSRVVDLANHRIRNVDSTTWLDGNYTIDWNLFVLAGNNSKESDWLSCPDGPTRAP
jgi:hypothetical protein